MMARLVAAGASSQQDVDVALKDIKDFHKTYYQPNNAILIVTGDVDPKEVFKKAKKEFGGIENKVKILPVRMLT